jgi:hypothetical protein
VRAKKKGRKAVLKKKMERAFRVGWAIVVFQVLGSWTD